MSLRAKHECDFTFLYAGYFYINETPSKRKYRWEEKVDGKWVKRHAEIRTCLELLVDPDEVTESAYLVTVEDEVVYVGEFSGTLRSRWLKVDNYIWHHKDHLVYQELAKKKNSKVEFWLLEKPVQKLENGIELNISKSVEHHILKKLVMPWNVRNASAKRG